MKAKSILADWLVIAGVASMIVGLGGALFLGANGVPVAAAAGLAIGSCLCGLLLCAAAEGLHALAVLRRQAEDLRGGAKRLVELAEWQAAMRRRELERAGGSFNDPGQPQG